MSKGKFRVCKTFTVESGHMLSKHPARCRHPHGHSRKVEVVVASDTLNAQEMVVDFKALRLALQGVLDKYDHSLSMNSEDPLLPSVQALHPEGVVVFERQDPTTEVLAQRIFLEAQSVLSAGFQGDGYEFPPSSVQLERVRVWETESSWAEFEA